MGYYRGGYYRGGYYRGGGIFSSIGKFLKKSAPILGGIIAGPIGALVGGTIAAAGSAGPGGAQPIPFQPTQPPIDMPGGRIPGTGIMIDPTAALPGGAPLTYTAPGYLGQRPAGYHVRKANAYHFGDGTIHYAGTEWVKNRQMNVANGRALKRAIRRARGFEKMARQCITFTTGKRPAKGRFKRR